jgi:hypothetical protein
MGGRLPGAAELATPVGVRLESGPVDRQRASLLAWGYGAEATYGRFRAGLARLRCSIRGAPTSRSPDRRLAKAGAAVDDFAANVVGELERLGVEGIVTSIRLFEI